MKPMPCLAALLLLLLLGPLPAARAADDEGIDFKLTLGHYASSDGNDANDINLRGSRGPHTGWVGLYRERSGFQQARTGYERHLDGDWLRSVLSLQWASGGAAVASITSEMGGSSYAIVGWGRTNVRNYVNLNYDPNDAITLGLGSRGFENTELSLFQVRDDRLHTGQQVTHAVLRRRFEGSQRLTVDLSSKRGLIPDGRLVSDRSLSLGYDRGPLFVRLTHDPHAGFTAANQNRLALGTRF